MQLLQKLDPETLNMLWRIYRQSKNHQVRNRAHCILLINSEYEIKELCQILGVSRKTVYNWKHNWSKFKLVGLYDRVGRGRKKIFNPEQKEQIKVWARQYQSHSRQSVIRKIRQEWGITVSKDTVKRALDFLQES